MLQALGGHRLGVLQEWVLFLPAQIPLGHLPASLPFSLSLLAALRTSGQAHMLFLTQNREAAGGGGRDVRRLTSSGYQLVGDRASPSVNPHFFLCFPSPPLWVLS